MKNLLLLIILGLLAWYGYGKYKGSSASSAVDAQAPFQASLASSPAAASPASVQFSCDGRTHCSHMRSCAEATYFIQHCPGTKMDGDNDGVPCESQWCN